MVGLSDNSRIKRKISGAKLTIDQSLNALMLDALYIQIWQQTKDGRKNKNKPESVYKKLMGLEKKQYEDLKSFDSIDDYERWYKAKMRS